MKPKKDKFIKGPIPVKVFERLVREYPPSVLLTYLTLIYVSGMRKSPRVQPKYSHAKELGVSPQSFRRCLVVLENAGIITTVRGRGVKPDVLLVDYKPAK